jgi:hypothetical protein
MLSVNYAECRYAGCLSAGRLYAGCRGASLTLCKPGTGIASSANEPLRRIVLVYTTEKAYTKKRANLSEVDGPDGGGPLPGRLCLLPVDLRPTLHLGQNRVLGPRLQNFLSSSFKPWLDSWKYLLGQIS